MKKKILTALLCGIIGMGITGCSGNDDTHKTSGGTVMLSDTIQVNQKLPVSDGENVKATFSLYFVTENEDVDITLKDVKGTEGVQVKFSCDAVLEDFAKGYSYEGYTAEAEFVDLEFVNPEAGQVYEIDSLLFEVDGEEVEIVPELGIKYEFYDDVINDSLYNNDGLQIKMMTNVVQELESTYNRFEVLKKMTINDAYFEDYINIKAATVMVNDVEVTGGFPVELKKGDCIGLSYEGEYKDKRDYPINTCTNLIISYEDANGEVRKAYYPFSIVEIYDTDDIDNLVKHSEKATR